MRYRSQIVPFEAEGDGLLDEVRVGPSSTANQRTETPRFCALFLHSNLVEFFWFDKVSLRNTSCTKCLSCIDFEAREEQRKGP